MFREKLPARQLSAWLFAGLTPVMIQLLSGIPWLWIGVAGILGNLAVYFVWRSGWEPKRWQCFLWIVYMIMVLGQLASHAAECWPQGEGGLAVPLILMALSAWSAQKGPSAAARVGAVLFWLVLIMYLAVFGAGAKDMRWEWLWPQWEIPHELGLLLFLLPAAAACLLRTEAAWEPRLILPSVFTLCASLITDGVLSSAVASKVDGAFYEMSRSINLMGVAQRFEAVISAGMTAGWFALLSMFLTVCGAMFQRLWGGSGKAGVWISALSAAIWMLCGLHISAWILLFGAAVFWVAMPLLTQGLEKIKKS